MIKTILGITLLAAFLLAGAKMKDNKTFVNNFFERLKSFNDELYVDISLYSRPISISLSELNESVQGVMCGVENVAAGEKFVFKDRRFNKKQKEFIEFYVNSLGRYDAPCETERLKSLSARLEALLAESKKTAGIYSALSIKLSFCLGLVLLVVII